MIVVRKGGQRIRPEELPRYKRIASGRCRRAAIILFGSIAPDRPSFRCWGDLLEFCAASTCSSRQGGLCHQGRVCCRCGKQNGRHPYMRTCSIHNAHHAPSVSDAMTAPASESAEATPPFCGVAYSLASRPASAIFWSLVQAVSHARHGCCQAFTVHHFVSHTAYAPGTRQNTLHLRTARTAQQLQRRQCKLCCVTRYCHCHRRRRRRHRCSCLVHEEPLLRVAPPQQHQQSGWPQPSAALMLMLLLLLHHPALFELLPLILLLLPAFDFCHLCSQAATDWRLRFLQRRLQVIPAPEKTRYLLLPGQLRLAAQPSVP